jgi:hypothetical protein
MQINLKIDHLILRGLQLNPTDQAELVASLQMELGRLLTMERQPQPWETLDGQDHLRAPAIRYQPSSSPTRLGRELAASLSHQFQAPNAASPASDKA